MKHTNYHMPMIASLFGLLCLWVFMPMPGHALSFDWTANTEADLAGYKLYRATYTIQDSTVQAAADPAVAVQAINDPATNYYRLTAVLSDRTTYFFRLTAFNTTGLESLFSGQVSTFVVADTSSPTAPTALTASNVGSAAFTLGWAAASDNVGVAGYRLDVSSSSGFSGFIAGFNNLDLGNVITKAVTGLAAGTTYYARLRAYDDAGNISVQSVSGSTVTLSAPPPAPNTVLNPGFESGTASWSFYTNGAGTFLTNVAGPASPAAAHITATSSGTNVQLYQAGMTLTAGVQYRVSFKAYSNTGHDVAVKMYKNVSPYTSYGLNSVINLTSAWADYSIDFTASGSTGTVNDGRLQFWLVPYAAAGDHYYIDDVSFSVAQTPDTQAPTVPAGLAALAVSSAQINLGWDASTDDVGVTGYQLDVSLNSGFSSFVAGYNSRDVGAVTSSLISGLADGTTYFSRLRAYDAAGNVSANSVSLSTVTLDVSSPTAPTALAASSVSSAAFTLGWAAASDNVGVAGYRLDVSSSSGFSGFVAGFNNLDLGNVVTKAVTGLAAGTTYYARVRAYDAAGNTSAQSVSGSTVTQPAPIALNPVLNPGFESGTASWSYYTNGVGTFLTNVVGPASPAAAHITATSSGTNIQLYQTGLPLVAGVRYRVSFKAYSNTGHDIALRMIKSLTPYTNYGLNSVINLTSSTWADYNVEFTAAGFTGTVNDGRLQFWLAPYAAAGDHYYIDDVSLSEAQVSDTQAPTVPAGLSAVAVSSTQLNLSWNPSTDDVAVAGYRLDVSLNQGFTSFLAGYGNKDLGNALNTDVTGLSIGTAYYSRLRAYDAAGNISTNSVSLLSAIPDVSSPTVPGGLAASNVGGAAFTLGWASSADDVGVAGYQLDVSSNSGFSGFVTGYSGKDVGAVTSSLVSGLADGTTYYSRLRAYDAAGNVSANSASLPAVTLDISSPAAPTALAASSISSAAYTLGWTAASDNVGVAGYRLDVSLNSGFTSFVTGYNNLNLGNVTSKMITGLAEQTPYYARLRAYDAAGNVSANHAPLLTTTPAGPDTTAPNPPTALAASNISSAAYTLGWTAATDNVGVTGYRLDVSLNSGFTSFVTGFNNLNLGNVSSKTITGLAAQTSYYARLRAYDAAGNISANSASLLTATLAGPDVTAPTAPGGLAASNISGAGFTLGWTAATDNVGVAGYRLDVSLNSGFSSFITGYSSKDVGAVTSSLVSGLADGTTYYSRLRAYDAAGNMSANSASLPAVTLDISSPAAPTALAASSISSAAYTLGWTAASDNVGVAGYRLDVSLNSGFTSFVAGYNNLNLGNVTSKLITGLSEQTPYYARLRAYDAAGNISANHAPLLTTTPAGPDTTAPNPPTAPAASNISSAAYTLGWTAATDNVGVTGYRLDVSLNSGFTSFVTGFNNLNLGNVSSKTITGLAAQTSYYARLRAYDAAGNISANSASLLTATLAGPDVTAPTAPGGLVSSNVSDTGFTLGWSAANDNVGVTGYRLDVSLNSVFTSFVAGYNNLNLGNVTSVAIVGMSPQTPYYARLRAYDAAGNVSVNSASGLTTTLAAPDVTAPNPPSGLVSSNVSDTGFILGWNAATDNVGVTGYRLDVSLNSGFTSFVTGYNNLDLGNVTSAAITGLSAQTPYYARLRAYDAAGNVSANSASGLTTTLATPDVTAPSAPGGLASSNISDTGFTLGWSAAADNVGVTGYRLDVSLNSGFTSFVTGYNSLNLGNVTSVAIAGLSPQTPYYARLRAYDAAGNVSANSASGLTTTLATPDVIAPSAPGGLASSNISDTGFTLGWSAAADNVGVTGYRLDVSLNSGFTSFVTGYSNLNLGNATSAAITGLSAQTPYYARLRAYDAAGNVSANSASGLTTTLATPDVTAPNPPSGLASSNISDTGFTLGWSAAADNVGVTGYRLDVSLNSGFTSFVAGYNNLNLGNVTSVAIAGLSEQTPYYARLRAYDAAGNVSGNSASSLTTTLAAPDVTAPAAPAALAALNISGAEFILNWSAAADNVGVTGYRLDVSLNSGFTSFVTGYSGKDVGAVTSSLVSGLADGTTYYSRLRAYDAAGNVSADSASLLTATLDISAPAAPGALAASSISSAAYTLGWTAASDNVGVAGYRLDVSLNSLFTSFVAGYNNLDLGNVTSKLISGLSEQTPYYARLRAYDAAGNVSAEQAPLLTTTLAGPDVISPNPPTALAASNISDTGFMLGWSAATDNVGVAGYRLDVSLNSGFTSFVAGYSNLDLGNVTSAAIAGLSAQTPYFSRLRAYDAAGNVSADSASSWAATLAAPDVTPPNAPSGLVSSNISDTGFTLGWSAAADNVGVAGYRLDVSLNSGFTSFVAGYNNLSLGNVASVAIAGLSAQTPYYTRLRAHDAAGNVSADSASSLVTTLATPDVTAPAAPGGLVSSNISDTGFTLGWSAATDNVGVAGYRLDVSLNSGFTSFVAGYNNLSLGNVTSAAIAGLSAQTPYYARLRAYDAAGNVSANSASGLTTTLATPDVTAPSAPGGLAASDISDTGFTLGWSAAADNVGVAGYRLDVSLNSGFTSFVAGYNNLSLGNVTSAAIAGLSAQTPYYARLRAYDAAGNISANSASGWATTTASVDVMAPVVFLTAPSAGAAVSGIIAVAASASDNTGVARVEFYVAGGLENTDTSAPYSFALDTTLLANGAYTILAKAYDAAGNSAEAAAAVTVSNSVADIVPPVVSITAPAGGASLSGTVEIKVSASDANGVNRVEFYIDNILRNVDLTMPYVYKCNTLKLTNGAHVLTVRAYDTGNNMAGASIGLNVDNRQRTDLVVTSTGSVMVAASASVIIAPLSIADSIVVSVVDEQMDEVELLAEREARARLQEITSMGAGIRLLPENYTVATPVKIKLPIRRGVTVSAALESVLGIYAWDDAANVWIPLPSTYDAADDTMNAESYSFSAYRLFSTMSVQSTPAVGSVYVFPNPAKRGAKPAFHIETETADRVQIQIFDFTGRRIHKYTLTGGPVLVNRNSQLVYAYEYEWDAGNAASGAYFYLITISGSGGETVKKGKFAIIR